MIISHIDNIAIHSSLLDKIDMECHRGKCMGHACCLRAVNLTENDIEKIRSTNLIKDFYDIGYNTMRVTSTSAEPWPKCVFFKDNVCRLEQLNAKPVACMSFPIVLDRNILRLSNKDLPCLKAGSTPAYILLEDEIRSLTSPDFYKKLAVMMAQPDEKLFLLA